MIWNTIYRLLKPYFRGKRPGNRLHPALKCMVKVTVSFTELYGYSLTVLDIDPAYTLGDIVASPGNTVAVGGRRSTDLEQRNWKCLSFLNCLRSSLPLLQPDTVIFVISCSTIPEGSSFTQNCFLH